MWRSVTVSRFSNSSRCVCSFFVIVARFVPALSHRQLAVTKEGTTVAFCGGPTSNGLAYAVGNTLLAAGVHFFEMGTCPAVDGTIVCGVYRPVLRAFRFASCSCPHPTRRLNRAWMFFLQRYPRTVRL